MQGHYPELWKRTKPMLQTDFLIRERITEWLADVKNKRVIDVGCGEGYIIRKLSALGAIVDAFDKILI